MDEDDALKGDGEMVRGINWSVLRGNKGKRDVRGKVNACLLTCRVTREVRGR